MERQEQVDLIGLTWSIETNDEELFVVSRIILNPPQTEYQLDTLDNMDDIPY